MHLNSRPAKWRPLVPAALLLAASLLGACSGEGTSLTASRAWVLEPSAEGVSIGGLTVHNRTDEDKVLVHILATDFEQAGIRAETENQTGSRPSPTVTVEADQATGLPPDGMVLFLENPARPLKAGDKTLLALHFDDGQAVFVDAEVRASPLPEAGP